MRSFIKSLPEGFVHVGRHAGGWMSRLIDALQVELQTQIKNSAGRAYALVKRWYWWWVRKKGIKGADRSHLAMLWKSIKLDKEVDIGTGPSWLREMFESIMDCVPASVFEPHETFHLFKRLLSDLEADPDAKVFNLLPLCSWNARFVPISTTLLVQFAHVLEEGKTLKDLKKDPDALWARYFNVKAVMRGKKIFAGRILTDGVSASVLCKRTEKRKIGARRVRLTDFQVTPVFGVDPGRRNIITAVKYSREAFDNMGRVNPPKFETFAVSNGWYQESNGGRRRGLKMKLWTEQNEEIKTFNASTLSSKTSSSENFLFYLKHLFKSLASLLNFNGARRVRHLRWTSFIKKKKTEEKIVKKFPRGAIIALGDASRSSTFGHLPSTPTSSLERLLKRRFRVYMVDEFRTSKLCAGCHKELGGAEYDGKQSYGVRRCFNNVCFRTFWDRDINGALNILKKYIRGTRGQGPPSEFSRSCSVENEQVNTRVRLNFRVRILQVLEKPNFKFYYSVSVYPTTERA